MPRPRRTRGSRLTSAVWMLCWASALATQLAQARTVPEVAESRYWKLLLHYHQPLLGSRRSDGNARSSFFLDPAGRTDPERELVADLKAFESPLPSNASTAQRDAHAQCRFPERFRFLKTELGLNIAQVDCTGVNEWRKMLDAQALSLVFAAAFMNNPASIAGHAFLSVRRAGSSPVSSDNPLLDVAVSYVGKTHEDQGFLDIFRGLFGWMKGDFNSTTFYETARIYSHLEGRDLWIYELNLDREQIQRLITHLWELHDAGFDYYFLKQNCSYQLMALLEVANPNWHVTDKVHWIANPATLVRHLSEIPGSIRSARFRPSLERELLSRYYALSAAEKTEFEARRDEPLPLSGRESAELLDAFMVYGNYALMKQAKQSATDAENPKVSPQYQKLAIARIKAGKTSSSAPTIADNGRPDQMHSVTAAGIDYGARLNQTSLGLRLAFAKHDLLDPDIGYLKYSQLRFLDATVSYYLPDRRARVSELSIIDNLSFNPLNPVDHTPSWGLKIGAYSPPDLACKNCVAGQISPGLGLSTTLFPDSRQLLVFGLARANFEYSGWFQSDVRFGPSVYDGAIAALGQRFKLVLDHETYWYPTQSGAELYHRLGAQAGWSPVFDWELRLKGNYFVTGTANFWELRAGTQVQF